MAKPEKPQLNKFKDAARELECDDDEQQFKARLGKLVRHRPVKSGAVIPNDSGEKEK